MIESSSMSTLTEIIFPIFADMGVLAEESSQSESMMGVCRPLLPFPAPPLPFPPWPVREFDRPTGSPCVILTGSESGSNFLFNYETVIFWLSSPPWMSWKRWENMLRSGIFFLLIVQIKKGISSDSWCATHLSVGTLNKRKLFAVLREINDFPTN